MGAGAEPGRDDLQPRLAHLGRHAVRADRIAVGRRVPTPSGEVTPFFQVWGQDSFDWEYQYTDEELRQLRALEAAGHEGSALNLHGYDGPTAVWSSRDSGTLCVIAPVGDENAHVCAENAQHTVTLAVIVGGIPARYVVTQAETRPLQLTVYKDIDSSYYFGE